MKVDLTDVNAVKKTLAVEADPEEVKRETDEVSRQYRQRAKVPGFRQGKAPLDVVRTRFAKEIKEEVRDRMVTRLFRDATREKGLRPLGEPLLDELEHPDAQTLKFKTTFEVAPKIEPKGYRDVEIRRPAVDVTDTEVEQSLEELRQSRVQFHAEEGREAATGDVIVADVNGTPETGDPFSQERMQIEVGAQDNLPAFNEALLGAKPGAQLEFPVDYPKDYKPEHLAGQAVSFKLEIHEVKRRELPELDDEFAKDLGEFDDLAALRARIREDLEARKRGEGERKMRESLMDKVLLENPVVLPEVLVESETRRRLEDLVRSLMMQGMDPEKAEIDWVEMRKRQEEPARKTVHAQLVLDAVAAEESLTVDDHEVDQRIGREAAQMGEKVGELKAKMRKHGGVEALKNQLLREKSLDYMTSVANIQNEE